MDNKKDNIEILGKIYEIEYFPDNMMQGLLGATNRVMQKINISTNQGKDSLPETILHEVIHIIDGDLKLELTEETISRLAVGLYSAGYRIVGGIK